MDIVDAKVACADEAEIGDGLRLRCEIGDVLRVATYQG